MITDAMVDLAYKHLDPAYWDDEDDYEEDEEEDLSNDYQYYVDTFNGYDD